MGISLDDVVKVSVNVSSAGSALSSLNLGIIIGQSTVITPEQRVQLYQSVNAMFMAGFSPMSPEYLAAQLYFSQKVKPSQVAIGRWNNPTESAIQAVMACRIANNDWYACMVTKVDKADILVISAYLESTTPISSYFYTTHDADVLAGTVGNVMQTLQSLNAHRTLGQYCTNSMLTYGYETGAIGGASDVHLGTLTTFKISVDGSAAVSVTLVVATLTTGIAIAAAMQSAIQALGTIYSGVTVVYTNSTYVITSGTQGILSSIIITAGLTNDITTGLKLGVLNGAIDIIGTLSYVDAVAAIMGYAMGATTGLKNSAYTLAYTTEVGVIVEPLTATQLSIIKGYYGNVYINRGATYDLFEQGTMADGTHFDELINIDILANNIKISVMNTLTSVPKIPQTDDGVTMLINAVTIPCIAGKATGFITPGVWNATSILNLKTGDTLSVGYLIQAESIASQSQIDRKARKSPPIYVAIKLAGAIEFVVISVIVNQ